MGKILEANQLTIGFRRHATSKSRSKWRISRILTSRHERIN